MGGEGPRRVAAVGAGPPVRPAARAGRRRDARPRGAAGPGHARAPARTSARDAHPGRRRGVGGVACRRFTPASPRRSAPSRISNWASAATHGSARATMPRPSRAVPTRCSSTTTGAASPTATSRRTTACAASCVATRARTCSLSTTASPRSTRSRPPWRTRGPRSAGRSRTRKASGPTPAGSAWPGTARAGTWPRSSHNWRRATAARRRSSQLLIYPATDFTRRRRSRELFGEGFLLTESEMDWFETNYLGPERTHARDPRASPLLAEELSGLAPAYIVTAAFDPLRDEGEEYASALGRAGTPVTAAPLPGLHPCLHRRCGGEPQRPGRAGRDRRRHPSDVGQSRLSRVPLS